MQPGARAGCSGWQWHRWGQKMEGERFGGVGQQLQGWWLDLGLVALGDEVQAAMALNRLEPQPPKAPARDPCRSWPVLPCPALPCPELS